MLESYAQHCSLWGLQDSNNSGANVKRLDQESKDQMKEIESSIAAKKKQVGDLHSV